MIDRKQLVQTKALNLSPLNKKAAQFLRQTDWGMTATMPAALSLIRWGLANGMGVKSMDAPDHLLLNLVIKLGQGKVMQLVEDADLSKAKTPEAAAEELLERFLSNLENLTAVSVQPAPNPLA